MGEFPAKYHVCLDLEMSELTPAETGQITLRGEVIQIGAVVLDGNFRVAGRFSTFVKPRFSHVTEFISTLTGIREGDIEDAPDFDAAMESYLEWLFSIVGESRFATYCWSGKDHGQLSEETRLKAESRDDFLENLDTFVDLQRTFGEVLGTKKTVGLETAIRFCHEEFVGNAHNALFDALNTAVILKKLCTGGFRPKFHFLSDALLDKIEEEKKAAEELKRSERTSLGDFFPRELLEKFGIKKGGREEIPKTEVKNPFFSKKMSKREKKLLKLERKAARKKCLLTPEIQSQIANSHPTLKYGISPRDWMKFYAKMIRLRADMVENPQGG